MHPQDRNVLTCICRDGISDETDPRHCIARRAAGSFYCGRCTPDSCACGCGPCDGSLDPSSDSDPGYHDPTTSPFPNTIASYATLGCLLLLGLPSRFYLPLPVAMHHICCAPTLLTIYQRIRCHFPRALHPLPRAACH